MAEKTAITWTHSTFNGWIGCTKVSEGCEFCYAKTLMDDRYGRVVWGPGKARSKTSEAYWKEPLRWQRDAVKRHADYLAAVGDPVRLAYLDAKHGGNFRHRVFCASLADWLDDDGVPIEWLAEQLGIIHATPDLDWLCLTKRPENFYTRAKAAWGWHINSDMAKPADRAFADWLYAWGKQGKAPENVWFGISGENEKRLWARWGEAKLVKAKVHFLSLEPLLEDVSGTLATIIAEAAALRIRLWAIVGGESGSEPRPFNIAWAANIVSLCAAHGVPCFVKQMGDHCVTDDEDAFDWPQGTTIEGPCPAGRVLLRDRKGGDMTEWPAPVRVRQFPGDFYRLAA